MAPEVEQPTDLSVAARCPEFVTRLAQRVTHRQRQQIDVHDRIAIEEAERLDQVGRTQAVESQRAGIGMKGHGRQISR